MEGLGVPHGRDSHVNTGALFGERLNIRRHHDDGDVFGGNGRSRNIDAVALKEVRGHLEGVSLVLIPVAIEANDEPDAGQLVLLGTGHIRDVLNARADSTTVSSNQRGGKGEENGNEYFHVILSQNGETLSQMPVSHPFFCVLDTAPEETYLMVASARL